MGGIPRKPNPRKLESISIKINGGDGILFDKFTLKDRNGNMAAFLNGVPYLSKHSIDPRAMAPYKNAQALIPEEDRN